jgi:hypothetical protein
MSENVDRWGAYDEERFGITGKTRWTKYPFGSSTLDVSRLGGIGCSVFIVSIIAFDRNFERRVS